MTKPTVECTAKKIRIWRDLFLNADGCVKKDSKGTKRELTL